MYKDVIDEVKRGVLISTAQTEDVINDYTIRAIDYVLMYIGESKLPNSLKFVAVEIAIYNINMSGQEQIKSTGSDSFNTTYNTDFLKKYERILDNYIIKRDEKKSKRTLYWL